MNELCDSGVSYQCWARPGAAAGTSEFAVRSYKCTSLHRGRIMNAPFVHTVCPMASRSRVLIVVFDALRPDMVSAQSMPNLHAFAQRGAYFTASRSSFPTETRVNQSALITGCYPQRHGVVGNRFFDASASPDALLNTGDEDALRRASEQLGGGILSVPSLGEMLYANGRSLATVSAGTPGGARLLHHSAESSGGFRLSVARPDATVAPIALDALLKKVGDIPKPAVPSVEWLRWSTDVYLSFVEPALQPDVGVIWYSEPDNSYHRFGVGSKESLTAIKAADDEFGRVLDWWQHHPEVQLITLSDHGQLAALGDSIDIDEHLRTAGFKVAAQPGDGHMASCLDTAGGIYLDEPDPALIERLVEFFADQPWCSVLSTRAGIGASITHADLLLDHARAPDVGVVLTAADQIGPHGLPGVTSHASTYGGGGVHGGLSPFELHNWLAMAGGRLQEGAVCGTVAGIVDVLPTVLTLLDLPTPAHVQGRVLREAFKAGTGPPVGIREDSSLQVLGRHRLQRQWVGETPYIDGLIPL